MAISAASIPMQIAGVVGHVSHWGLERDTTARVRSEVYLPLSQIPDPFMKQTAASSIFVVRTGTDPLTFAGVALVLAVVALIATLVPARRATRVAPAAASREE